jgi:endoglucanase
VSAVKPGGETANSTEAGATPQSAPPANLNATPGDSQVTLTWLPAPGATGYNVKRASVSGGPYFAITNVTVTGYTDAGLANGAGYYYVVSAVTSGGETANSTEAAATPHLPLPSAPAAVGATPANGEVILTWQPNPDATEYYVWRALATGGPYALIGITAQPGWTDFLAKNGTAYFYVITSVNATGESLASVEVGALPQVIVNLNLDVSSDGSQLTLFWPNWATNLQVNVATNLAPPVFWQPVTNAPQDEGGVFQLTLPTANESRQFFRLTPQ